MQDQCPQTGGGGGWGGGALGSSQNRMRLSIWYFGQELFIGVAKVIQGRPTLLQYVGRASGSTGVACETLVLPVSLDGGENESVR